GRAADPPGGRPGGPGQRAGTPGPGARHALVRGPGGVTVPPRRLALLAFAALAAAPATALGSGGETPTGGAPTYIQLPGVAATIVRRDGRRGVLSVDSGVDVPDGKLRALAASSVPRLRD